MRELLGFGKTGQMPGTHLVPSSCTRHKSLCSSEKISWGSSVGYTMEALVCVQTCGSFQNPGWTVGRNSGREEGVGKSSRSSGPHCAHSPTPAPGSCGSEPKDWVSLPGHP